MGVEVGVGDAIDCPVFLWADESQYFVTSEDMIFQQTARSRRAATVFLTQNISNYYAMLDARNAHTTTDSLLGNLQTKIFHAQGDPAINEWAERIFAKERQRLFGDAIGTTGAHSTLSAQGSASRAASCPMSSAATPADLSCVGNAHHR